MPISADERGSHRNARRTWAAAAIALATLTLSACGGDSDDDALPSGSATASPSGAATSAAPTATATTADPTAVSTTGTTRSPILWHVRSTGNAEKDAVVRAVQAYWSMTAKVAEDPDPNDPLIAATTIDPLQAKIVGVVTGWKQDRTSQRGPAVGSIAIKSLSGDSASATTCLDQTKTFSYDAQGKALPGSRGGLNYFVLSVRKVGGGWKVAEQESPDGTNCTVQR